MDAEDNLTEKVRSWIERSGASFEMATAKVMVDSGLGVEQGHYYTDPDEGTSREIDVIASTSAGIGNDVALGLAVVIECKYAPTPWVLYRHPPTENFNDPDFDRISTALGTAFLAQARSSTALAARPLFRREPNPGYALTTSDLRSKHEGGRDASQDLAYKALQTVIKASLALARERESTAKPQWMTTIFPVIAVRGRLFESWLQPDGQVFAAETQRCQIHYSYPGIADGRVLVDVVTESALPQLALDAVSTAGGMTTEASNAAQQAIAAIHSAKMPRRIR